MKALALLVTGLLAALIYSIGELGAAAHTLDRPSIELVEP